MTTATNNLNRAEECAQFANSTRDSILRADLLTLRQKYLNTAERLRQKEEMTSKK